MLNVLSFIINTYFNSNGESLIDEISSNCGPPGAEPSCNDTSVKNNKQENELMNNTKSGVLIFCEKSVFFSFQSPKLTNQTSFVFQKLELYSRCFFKDDRQTADWWIQNQR